MEARPPDGFERIRLASDGTTPAVEILADVARRASVLELELDRPERLAESSAVEFRVEGGRVPHPVIRAGDELWLVKSYRRGGVVSLWNTDIYFGRGRFLRELEVSILAARSDVTRAAPVALVMRPAMLGGVRAWLVSRYVENTRSLGQILGAGDDAGHTLETAFRAAGHVVRRMHAIGIDHPDLNLNNVLCTRGGSMRAFIVDWDRAVVRSPWRETFAHGNLLRLYRSALKLQPDFSRLRRGLLAFVRGYFESSESRSASGSTRAGLAGLRRYYRRKRLMEVLRHPAYWRLALRPGTARTDSQ